MHKYLIYAAYGWLALSGTLHFVVDVVSQHLRGKRTASLETTLYYGLNSAFSLGQVAFGLLGLFLAWRHMDILNQTPVLALSLIAGMGWLALTFFFMGYWEPKVNASIFCVLILSVIVTR